MSRPEYQMTPSRDAGENIGLDLQHLVYKTNIGFLLHPRIAQALPQHAQIAEVGTGTGIWLQDLEGESANKSWIYYGLDKSNEHFPKHRTGGIGYEVLDISQDILQMYRQRYEAVHMKLVCGLSTAQMGTAASNVFRSLRPGGWIQWAEGDLSGMKVMQSVPGVSRAACEQLRDFALSGQGTRDRFLPEAAPDPLDIVRRVGFEQCQEDRISSDRIAETRAAANEIAVRALVTICRSIAREQPELGWSVEKVGEMARLVEGELKDLKVYYRWDLCVVTGRKPRG